MSENYKASENYQVSENHEDTPVGAAPLLITVVGLLALFLLFYAVGQWAVAAR